MCAIALAMVAGGGQASADGLAEREILPPRSDAFHVDSIATQITSFDQFGRGYQSQAGPILGPGDERATILEPQIEIDASQGERLHHRFWIPVDIVTAASPDALDSSPQSADVVSSASRKNVAGTIAWTGTYRADPATDVSLGGGIHLEEPFRSWHAALGGSRSFADGDTVLSGRILEVFDWFDQFDVTGHRHGRTDRASTTASVGVTQILTPTTVANLNYGITLQQGELGNTWNSVPLTSFDRGPEILPEERVRHALVARVAQFLPWNGSLRLYYRFYADDWGLIAHAAQGEISQRLSPIIYVSALYRFYTQTGVDFFTTLAPAFTAQPVLRTADSDLAPLDSHTIGGKVTIDIPLDAALHALHLEIGYERYFRTNDLRMNVLTWATGYTF